MIVESEFRKLLRKPRTYIGSILSFGLVVLILIATKYGHQFEYMQDRLSQDFVISGSFVNGCFLARYFLLTPVVLMFLPLLTCTVFGDLVASEAADGTLRTLLCRPVTRPAVLVSKYIVGAVYTLALTLGAGLLTYLLGVVFLGRGGLVSLTGGIWIFSEKDGLIRLAEVYLLISVGMIAVGSLAFAVSTFIDNPNAAIAGAMGLLIASEIIGRLEFFEGLKPFLLTTYMEADSFFTGSLNTALYWRSIGVMLAYTAVSFIISMIIFCRRDVLT